MRTDNTCRSKRNEEPDKSFGNELVQYQERKADREKNQRQSPSMMLPVAMSQREDAKRQRHDDHGPFDGFIFQDIDTEQWQAGDEQRQDRAMDRAGDGSNDT